MFKHLTAISKDIYFDALDDIDFYAEYNEDSNKKKT